VDQMSNLSAPVGYLENLERSGLRAQQWLMDEGGIPVGSQRLRYTSWSDGNIGIFLTDTASCALTSVIADVISDFVVIAIPFADIDPTGYALEISDNNVPVRKNIWIRYCNKGSDVRLRTSHGSFKSVTLLIKVSTLQGWCPELPRVLQSTLESQQSTWCSMPVQIKHERDQLLQVSEDLPYSSLFYRTKSNMILWHLIDHLRRYDEESSIAESINDRVRGQLELVRQLIDTEPQQRLSVDEMARRAGTNRTSLRTLFKQVYGMTLSDYRTTELMRRADHMLRSDRLPVAETAYALGYSDASSFSAAFKRHFGRPPGHRRKVDD